MPLQVGEDDGLAYYMAGRLEGELDARGFCFCAIDATLDWKRDVDEYRADMGKRGPGNDALLLASMYSALPVIAEAVCPAEFAAEVKEVYIEVRRDAAR